MIERIELENFLAEYCKQSEHNIITKNAARTSACEGLKMYEAPIVGISSAEDELYLKYKNADAIGEHYLFPTEWQAGAKSVISIFNPFTDVVKTSNRGGSVPSDEWMHARIEGQTYVVKAALALAEYLTATYNVRAIVPVSDNRFQQYSVPKIYSNWSERHAAYVSGLGTFSLNRGLITRKGIAGRLCSVIIDAEMKADRREYTGLYDNCIMCGACQLKCPAAAIDESGKSHVPCMELLGQILALNTPYYGCGKCQSGMPCESAIPEKTREIDYSGIRNNNNG